MGNYLLLHVAELNGHVVDVEISRSPSGDLHTRAVLDGETYDACSPRPDTLPDYVELVALGVCALLDAQGDVPSRDLEDHVRATFRQAIKDVLTFFVRGRRHPWSLIDMAHMEGEAKLALWVAHNCMGARIDELARIARTSPSVIQQRLTEVDVIRGERPKKPRRRISAHGHVKEEELVGAC